ncbi:Late embryogenesis abundant protein 6, partial [Mucuna pruriens]
MFNKWQPGRFASHLPFPYKSSGSPPLFYPNALLKSFIYLYTERREKRPTRVTMQSSKEKLSNVASEAKEHVDIYKAKLDEKQRVNINCSMRNEALRGWVVQAEKGMARTEEEKVIAHERAKAKEAKAKMELHEAKARHAEEKLRTKQSHSYGLHHDPPVVGTTQTQYQQQQGHQPIGTALVPPGATYPLIGGNPPRNKHI